MYSKRVKIALSKIPKKHRLLFEDIFRKMDELINLMDKATKGELKEKIKQRAIDK